MTTTTALELDNRTVFGGSLAIVGGRGLGVEVDLGFMPDFFEPKDLDIDVLGDNNVTTVMGNLMFARSAGGFRPYVTGGAGLIRSQVGDFGELFDAAESSLGVNVGGGLFLGSGRILAARRPPLLPEPVGIRRRAHRAGAAGPPLLARHGRG